MLAVVGGPIVDGAPAFPLRTDLHPGRVLLGRHHEAGHGLDVGGDVEPGIADVAHDPREADLQGRPLTHRLDQRLRLDRGRAGATLALDRERLKGDAVDVHVLRHAHVVVGGAPQPPAHHLLAQQLRAERAQSQHLRHVLGVPPLRQHGHRHDAADVGTGLAGLAHGRHATAQRLGRGLAGAAGVGLLLRPGEEGRVDSQRALRLARTVGQLGQHGAPRDEVGDALGRGRLVAHDDEGGRGLPALGRPALGLGLPLGGDGGQGALDLGQEPVLPRQRIGPPRTLRKLVLDLLPEVEVARQRVARVVVDGHPRHLHDARLDGVEEAEVARRSSRRARPRRVPSLTGSRASPRSRGRG